MKAKLKKEIEKLLKKGETISFTAETARQGGPLVYVMLNSNSIGEVYTYNSEKSCYENIPTGSPENYELGESLEEWIHFDFFDYIRKNDELLREFYDCEFKLEGNDILLEIKFYEEDEFSEIVYDDNEEPIIEKYIVTLEEIESSNKDEDEDE